MTFVKETSSHVEPHLALLVGRFFDQVRQLIAEGEWEGLRASQFRVIEAVPPHGASVTELAEQLRMTKQGCGQLVTALVGSGHLREGAHSSDRRVRVVTRTEAGERVHARFVATLADRELDWAAAVGERRYRTFRRVLEELAHVG